MTGKVQSYYNFAKLFSYNAYYNGCIGGRGLGKTFGAKEKAIKDAIKAFNPDDYTTTNQFIYLRRYKEELRMSRETFFADVAFKFPKWEFRIHGMEAQMSPLADRDTKKRQWVTIGYFIPLSVAQSFKSVAFPNVKLIIFDEFIIEKGAIRYLPDEAKAFNNFYSTVDRYKGKTRVLFLANSVAVNNPYFIEYKVEPQKADENGFIRMALNPDTGIHFMLWHFPDSEAFESEVYQTAFGKFIHGTEYADYAVGNEFGDNHESLINEKPSSAKYFYSLESTSGTFSVWYDVKANEYHVQSKRPREETMFTLLRERMSEEKTLMEFSDKPLGDLRTAFRHARVTFDRPSTRNAFLEIFKR